MNQITNQFPRSVFFIINPRSGSSRRYTLIKKLKQCLEDRNCKSILQLTKSKAHTIELVNQARALQVDVVAVSGGDGTVREVVAHLAHTDIGLLVIPTGTENLLACELGLNGSLDNCIAALESGLSRRLDIGRVNNEYFMAVTGLGFDAEVIRRLHLVRDGHIGHSDYVWPICRTFWEYMLPQFEIIADGKPVFQQRGVVLIGNISRYATGLCVLSHANGFDGWLDLVIFPCRHRFELLAHAGKILFGRGRFNGSVIRRRCKHITITSKESNIPVEIDGDPGPALPLKIEVIPAATRLLLPQDPSYGKKIGGGFHLVKRWLIR